MRIPEDATHEVLAFFGQKKVRIYPLRRTYDYDLVDRPGAAPGAPANSATLTQLFFPTWSN
ncbi:MAG TPA: hypothetical protein VHW72_21405 [Candidatus Angelobacter sp.]|nr:hypothetical protein [Candidatus Angelobacter sp.]